jgi:hypothetical protein
MADDSQQGSEKLLKTVFVLTIIGVGVFAAVVHLFILWGEH